MSLPVFQRTIVTEAGDVIAGAEVEVVNEATGLAADIFSDRAGNTARTNPFFTGADGFAKFFAAPAEYRITATGPTGSIVFRFVVLVGDIARQDANSVNVTGGTVNPTTLQQGGSQAYVRSNILGTVSQSSGVPTGAIIQRGSNANGEFVRYADGTLICTHSMISNLVDTSSLEFIWSFPSAFLAAPALTFMADATEQTDMPRAKRVESGNVINQKSSTSARLLLESSGLYTQGTEQIRASISANGRWF